MILIMNVLFSLAVSSGIAVLMLYFWFKLKYTYWKSRGVAGPAPSFPFGNADRVFRREILMSSYFEEIYKEYPNEPFVGLYVLYNPVLVVRDPALAGRVLTQDAHHFDSRGLVYDESNPLSTHLFAASGAQWKMLRAKLSPTFTSGKMKMMFKTMADVADALQQHAGGAAAASQDVDFKDLLARYTTDVIGSCAFGVECNSFTSEMSEFRKYGNRIIESTFLESLTIAVHLFAPELRSLVTLPIMNKSDVRDFLVEVFTKTTSFREKHHVKRNDFLQLLIQLKNNSLTDDDGNLVQFADGKGLSENLLVAQVFIFFLAGFETSSTAASFAMHELALNPHIQERARREVLDVVAANGGDCSYEAIMQMEYLTYVVDETLRKYPPLSMLFRRCTIPYKVPNSNYCVEEGTLLFVPINALQMDPDHFDNPEKFDPERFRPANRSEKMNSVYMPFGQGPRFCIGQRFGMMQTKLALAKLLMKYEVSPCSKTVVPVEYDPAGFTINPKGGLWLRINQYRGNAD